MSQMDDPENQSPDAKYENILRNTLLKRTGRSFKRNVDAAYVPKQEKEKHEDVANRIFDNILKRKLERAEAQDALDEAPVSDAESTEPADISKTYTDILDDLLWPAESEASSEANFNPQQTLAENNQPEPEAAPPPPDSPYESILRRTLNQRKDSLNRRKGKLRVEASDPLPAAKGSELESIVSQTEEIQPLSHHYSAALDEILGFNENDAPFQALEEPSLSRTLYNQKLDELLWPSQQKAAANNTAALDLPPVDEAKLRSVIADYLRQLILPESYGLIGVQRRVLDERYCLFWVRETLHQMSETLKQLEVDFSVWLFVQNISLLKRLINKDFIDHYRMMIEQMLPAIKPVSPFNRKKTVEPGRLLERMADNKFDDVRRLLKNNKEELNDEEILIFFNFFKQRLPEFFKTHHKILSEVLHARSEDSASNPFIGSFLAGIFFAPPFEALFQQLRENEDRYKQTWQNFLRDKSEGMVNKSDPLIPLILSCMDLFHEKAAFFRPSERETLHQAIELLEGLMRFLSDDYFNKEDLLAQFQSQIDTRVQTQFHVEAQALQALGQEIGALAYQSDQSARIRASHLNAIYERHNQEMADAYHKRRDTLDKLTQGKGPSWQSRKQFIQRKLKACQQYLQRSIQRQSLSLEVPYREYAPEFLVNKQKELAQTQSWDNDYEKQILEQAFEKANMVLKSLNHNKSTVKFNLKVLFDGEPQQEVFLQALSQIRDQLRSMQASMPGNPSLNYLQAVLQRYLIGLRLPEPGEHDTYLSGPARTGYIIAYLAHVSHIKLLVNLQFQQVIYDFQTLYELAHTLYMLDAAYSQPSLKFEEHYRQTLLPAWHCILQYCLLVGSGQYHFVSNPLALHDYSWQAPVEFGFSDFGDDDSFDTLSMDQAPDADMVRFPALKRELKVDRGDDRPIGYRPKRRFGQIEDPEDPSEQKIQPPGLDQDDSQDLPSMPSLPSRRRLPVSPGKFEMYSAPTNRRAQPPLGNQFEEDNLYSVLSQNQPAPQPSEPSTPPAQSFRRPRGLSDLNEPDKTEASSHFVRPRGLDNDDLPLSKTRRNLGLTEPAETPEAPPAENPRGKRKRWLEITPVPQDRKDYDQMLDSILDSWDTEDTTVSPPSDDSQNVVDQILRRNRLDPNMQADGNTSISNTVRRKLDDD